MGAGAERHRGAGVGLPDTAAGGPTERESAVHVEFQRIRTVGGAPTDGIEGNRVDAALGGRDGEVRPACVVLDKRIVGSRGARDRGKRPAIGIGAGLAEEGPVGQARRVVVIACAHARFETSVGHARGRGGQGKCEGAAGQCQGACRGIVTEIAGRDTLQRERRRARESTGDEAGQVQRAGDG